MGAVATLDPKELTVEPGGEAVCQIRFRNTGHIVDEFAVEVVGDPAQWATSEPPTVSLFPDAEAVATVRFAPPRVPTIPAGPVGFGVRIQSREDPDGSTVEEGILDVLPFTATTAELVPRTSRGRTGAAHDLAVDNRGNVRLNANLSAADADQILRFEMVPPGLVAEPGAASFAKVRVSSRQRFFRGPPRTHPFQVFVAPQGQEPIALEGTMLQEALLPRWLLPLLILLLLLTALLIALWLTVLKPNIESAAREAVESPLAEQAAAIEALESQLAEPGANGGADGGADGGEEEPEETLVPSVPPAPEPTPTPRPTPAGTPGGTPATAGSPTASPTPTPTGAAVPQSGRIEAGDFYRVPADRTLSITDVVFENPDDDNRGILRLYEASSGRTFFVLQLENFRSLDYHFVTPIRLGPGETLALAADCTGCDDPLPSVYYSGSLRP